MNAPPPYAIAVAERAAARSPCAKSKRGVVLFSACPPGVYEGTAACNRPPMGAIPCDGSDACRASCAKRCLHAELLSVRLGLLYLPNGCDAGDLELVHVKIGGDGKLVAGGGPSCWQCSREILDVGIAFVWLYEYNETAPASAAIHGNGAWRRYTAEEFHAATCRACEVY